MRQRQEILTKILTQKFGSGRYYPNSIELTVMNKAGLSNEVGRTYRKLGGILEVPPRSFGKWDICLNGFIVEFDEEQHFNRYRAITLESYIYHINKGFDIFDYARYCADYESNCLKKSSWGKYWTSPSTAKQFCLPGLNGNLEINGSPRWRQRAYYDYLRDVFAIIYRIPVIRVSIYDMIVSGGNVKSVGMVLSESNTYDLEGLVKFIALKAAEIL